MVCIYSGDFYVYFTLEIELTLPKKKKKTNMKLLGTISKANNKCFRQFNTHIKLNAKKEISTYYC
jgi:late competence protein required for DNA uptake (superfamily II DNA/RNA helicase)